MVTLPDQQKSYKLHQPLDPGKMRKKELIINEKANVMPFLDFFAKMTADELQNWTGYLRWIGGVMTGLGLVITLTGAYVADTLIKVQRADKAKSAAALQETQGSLLETRENLKEANAKLAEVTKVAEKMAPRKLTDKQRKIFLEYASRQLKGRVALQVVNNEPEAWDYAQEIKAMLIEAGFEVNENMEEILPTSPRSSSFLLKLRSADSPYAGTIQHGFEEAIGLPIPAVVLDPKTPMLEDVVLEILKKR